MGFIGSQNVSTIPASGPSGPGPTAIRRVPALVRQIS
jgi:hypothetical protein